MQERVLPTQYALCTQARQAIFPLQLPLQTFYDSSFVFFSKTFVANGNTLRGAIPFCEGLHSE